jgi:Tol biopolymer transport system component
MNADYPGEMLSVSWQIGAPAWSPDGHTVVCDRRDPTGYGSTIVVMDVDGTSRRLSDGPDDFGPVWSPDGRKIAFWRRPLNGDDAGICVMNADGSGQRQLTPFAAQWILGLEWSPDGQRIAFNHDGEIWLINADGSSLMQLVDSQEPSSRPVWSPDGRRIAFLRDNAIHIMNVVARSAPAGPCQDDWPRELFGTACVR